MQPLVVAQTQPQPEPVPQAQPLAPVYVPEPAPVAPPTPEQVAAAAFQPMVPPAPPTYQQPFPDAAAIPASPAPLQPLAPQPAIPMDAASNVPSSTPAQPLAPQAPMAIDPQAYQPAPIPMTYGNNTSSLRKKRLLAIVLGVAVLAAGAGVAAYVLLFAKDRVPHYAAKDLVSFKTEAYEASHPKQWQEITDKEKVRTLLADETLPDDVKLFGYKYDAENNIAQAVYATGAQASGMDDALLKTLTGSGELQKRFESTMRNAFNTTPQGDTQCASTTNVEMLPSYQTAHFSVQLIGTYDCQLKPEDRQKRGYDSIHKEILLGFKDTKVYTTILVVSAADWAKNKDFYRNDLLPSIKSL